jgi:hypothetical protein
MRVKNVAGKLSITIRRGTRSQYRAETTLSSISDGLRLPTALIALFKPPVQLNHFHHSLVRALNGTPTYSRISPIDGGHKT